MSAEECSTYKVPKKISFIEKYVLFFYDSQLKGIVMQSTAFEKDRYGYAAQELYSTIKKTLVKKYGKFRSLEHIDKASIFGDPKYFWQCLGYSGCGSWKSGRNIGGGGGRD